VTRRPSSTLGTTVEPAGSGFRPGISFVDFTRWTTACHAFVKPR
jgi:hypothetical protein